MKIKDDLFLKTNALMGINPSEEAPEDVLGGLHPVHPHDQIDPIDQTVTLDGGDILRTKSIVLATGVEWRRLKIFTA